MKSILVTGASSGIGEACALDLDRHGHRVYAGVRRTADGERLASLASDRLVPVILDVTDEATIEAAAKRIREEAGGELHGLVNNAGIGRGGPLEYLDIAEWREQLDVNVIGQVAVTKSVLPLIRSGQGRVVFIGSIGGKVATMMMSPYNASKFAIEGIGSALRQELHPWGIKVAVIEPGAIKTEIWSKATETADRLEEELPPEARSLYGSHMTTLRKVLAMQDRNAVPAQKVADAVRDALFSSRPRPRYVVGTDARAMSAMARLLPESVREALLRRVAAGA